MMAQMTEQLSGTVIYPFMPQMVARTGIINGDEKRTGYYTGILVSIELLFYGGMLNEVSVGISVLLVSRRICFATRHLLFNRIELNSPLYILGRELQITSVVSLSWLWAPWVCQLQRTRNVFGVVVFADCYMPPALGSDYPPTSGCYSSFAQCKGSLTGT